MERLKIAITGSSGFIGANLVRSFDNTHEVFPLTRNTNNWRLGSQFKAIKFNILEREKVREIIGKLKPDVLIHCAAYGGLFFETNVRNIVETDLIGSMNLIDASKDVPVVLNTGSSTEYGIRRSPMKESDLIAPTTQEGMTKALQTSLFRSAHNSLTLRLFSVYGYYEEKHRLISHLIYSLIEDQKPMLSSLNNVRDFVFIEDVSKAYSLAISNYDKVEKGSIFNIGTGIQSTILDIVNELKVEVDYNPSARTEEPKRMWQADISKTMRELKWIPQHSLRDGLKKTKEWMEKNLHLYEGDENDKLARSKQSSGQT